MSTTDPAAIGTGWFKSSHSGDAQTCVEVRFDTSRVLVRDSKYAGSPAAQPILTFGSAAWGALLAEIRNGRFAA